MKGVVVCNGSIRDDERIRKYFQDAGLIICADGGAVHLMRLGIRPHVLVGDFDSIPPEVYGQFEKDGVEIARFSTSKDMTDTEIAVDLAMDRGCKTVVLVGALGSRLDHSLSNIFHLKRMMDRGVSGIVVDEQNEIMLMDKHIRLVREEGLKVTLLPFSEAVSGVTTRGLQYPLFNATIPLGSSWGVSNEFSEDIAEVSISAGLLLVIKSKD